MDRSQLCPTEVELQRHKAEVRDEASETAPLDLHLKECEACQQKAAEYEALNAILTTCRPLSTPEGLEQRVLQRVLASSSWQLREAGREVAVEASARGAWLLFAALALVSALALSMWPGIGSGGGLVGAALTELLRTLQGAQLVFRVLSGAWQLFEPIRGPLLLLASALLLGISALGRRIVVSSAVLKV